MIEEHPATLLSRNLRQLLLDKAKKVNELHAILEYRLCVDWPEPRRAGD